MLISLLLSLIDKGIDLLREGQKQRKAFSDDVLTPLHDVFEKLHTEHVATFAMTRSMLLDPNSNATEIRTFLKGRRLLESGTTRLLYDLTSSRINLGSAQTVGRRKLARRAGELRWASWSRSGGDPDDLNTRFHEYIESIAVCLIAPFSQPTHGVIYYAALRDIADRLSKSDFTHDDRERALNDLDSIVVRFEHYYADVTRQYLRLREACAY